MACTWAVLVGVTRPVVSARCPCATSCWSGPCLVATTRLRTPDTKNWTIGLQSHVMSCAAVWGRPLPLSPHCHAPVTKDALSRWDKFLVATGHGAYSMYSASQRRSSGCCCWQSGKLCDICRSCCWSCKCVLGCLGRGSKACNGHSFFSCDLTCRAVPSSLSICKRRCGKKSCDWGSFTPMSHWETPCSKNLLPGLRAVLSPTGGCCRTPRAGWGEG